MDGYRNLQSISISGFMRLRFLDRWGKISSSLKISISIILIEIFERTTFFTSSGKYSKYKLLYFCHLRVMNTSNICYSVSNSVSAFCVWSEYNQSAVLFEIPVFNSYTFSEFYLAWKLSVKTF